jgi:hypothetical protein
MTPPEPSECQGWRTGMAYRDGVQGWCTGMAYRDGIQGWRTGMAYRDPAPISVWITLFGSRCPNPERSVVALSPFHRRAIRRHSRLSRPCLRCTHRLSRHTSLHTSLHSIQPSPEQGVWAQRSQQLKEGGERGVDVGVIPVCAAAKLSLFTG